MPDDNGISDEEYLEATRKGQELHDAPTAIMEASVSHRILKLVQRDGNRYDIPVASIAPFLANATDKQLADLTISPMREGIWWNELDEGLHVQILLRDLGIVPGTDDDQRRKANASIRKVLDTIRDPDRLAQGMRGQIAANAQRALVCSLCGERGHLVADCPESLQS